MQEDDAKIQEFRNILRNIKQNVMNKITYASQNTEILKKVPQRLIQFYTLLSPVVFHNKAVNTIPIEELQGLFYETLEAYPRSSYYQNQIEYYLKRDFIEFPFTIDEDRIDAYDIEDHYEEPHIVENNIDLTK